MPTPSFPEFKPGQRPDAATLNRMMDLLESYGRVSGSAGGSPGGSNFGIEFNIDAGGMSLTDNLPKTIVAKITSGSNPYAWSQVMDTNSGATVVPGDGLSGTTGSLPLYEENGSTTVSAGTVVQAWLALGSGDVPEYRFCAAGAGGGLTVTDGTNTVTGVSQITFSGATVGGSTPNATVTTSGGGSVYPGTNDFRLTLQSGHGVPNADQLAKGTIYLTPWLNDGTAGSPAANIAIYNGSSWAILSSVEVSLAITATSGTVYDVFAANVAGTLTLSTVAWATLVTRTTALAIQDGQLVLSGTPTKRYVGSFYANATNATEDSAKNRLVWNYANRVRRQLASGIPVAASWTTGGGSWQECNSSAGLLRTSFVSGLDFISLVDLVFNLYATSGIKSWDGVGIAPIAATGLPIAGCQGGQFSSFVASQYCMGIASYRSGVSAGLVQLCGINRQGAGAATTFYNSSIDGFYFSQISGSFDC